MLWVNGLAVAALAVGREELRINLETAGQIAPACKDGSGQPTMRLKSIKPEYHIIAFIN